VDIDLALIVLVHIVSFDLMVMNPFDIARRMSVKVTFCGQAVQKDIESRSRVVSAVLKLCEWLKAAGGDGEEGDGAMAAKRAAVHAEAEAVEQRWHSVWIQSLEWQLRIEDAIAGRHVRTS